MIKALTNIILLFLLVLLNMALFTWCVNQLNLNQVTLKKTLISNVQAEATPSKPVLHHQGVPVHSPRLIFRHATHTTSHPTHSREPKQRLNLHFQSVQTYLDKSEQIKLENLLQQFKISHAHAAKVLFGPAPFKNNIPSLQIAKLRAQHIARVIYPYTQTVKMSYSSSLKEGEAIVEFFEPQSQQRH